MQLQVMEQVPLQRLLQMLQVKYHQRLLQATQVVLDMLLGIL